MTLPRDYLTLGIFGRSGSGKSSLLKEALRGESRVVAFDPLAEMTGRGWKTFSGQMQPLLKHMGASGTRLRASYQPAKGVDRIKALDRLSEAILKAQGGFKAGRHRSKILFVVEEMSGCFPLGAEKKCPNFVEICDRGRHYGIRVCGVSQGVNKVAGTFRDRLDAVCVLAQMRKSTQETAADLIGEHWRTVRDLQNFEYLAYQNGKLWKGQTKK